MANISRLMADDVEKKTKVVRKIANNNVAFV